MSALRQWLAGALVGAGGAGLMCVSALTLAARIPPPPEYVLPGVGETTMPPTRFRAPARATIEYLDPSGIAAACAGGLMQAGTSGPPLACTKMYPNRPTIVMPNPCAFPFDAYARMECHELGHVNGWEHEMEGEL